MKINGKPDGGGGGVITSLIATSNGTYIPSTGVDGFAPVDVSVPIPSFVTESLSVTSNGTYTPGEGVDGYSQVSVAVQAVTTTLSASVNGTFTPTAGVDGYSQVVVSVPIPSFVTESLSVTSNGTYTPGEGVDGYSQVSVAVQAVTTTLSTSVNGTFTPTAGVDGFSQVVVSVPQTGYSTNNIVMGYLESNISIIYDSTITYVTNGGLMGVKWYYSPEQNTQGQNYSKRNDAWLLTQIDFPNVSIVGMHGFYSQSKLQSIYLSKCVLLGDSALERCTALTTVSLPICKELMAYTFRSCTALSELVLPKCQDLHNYVFQDCTNLTKLTLGYSSVCIITNFALRYSPIASGTCSVYVPTSLVDAYKSAQYWSSYSNQIFPIPE